MLLFKMRSQWTSLSSKSNDSYHTGLGESEKSLSCARLFVTPDCSPPGSCQWNSAGNNGVGRHCLLQGIFPTQGSNLGFHLCGQILYHLSHQGGSEGHGWPEAETGSDTGSSQGRKKQDKVLPSSLYKEHSLSDTLVSDLHRPELRKNKLLSL